VLTSKLSEFVQSEDFSPIMASQGTGASIQVASEMLPNSTERAVTISGSAEAIGQSVNHICGVFVEVSRQVRAFLRSLVNFHYCVSPM
jgi:hypothetical protein